VSRAGSQTDPGEQVPIETPGADAAMAAHTRRSRRTTSGNRGRSEVSAGVRASFAARDAVGSDNAQRRSARASTISSLLKRLPVSEIIARNTQRKFLQRVIGSNRCRYVPRPGSRNVRRGSWFDHGRSRQCHHRGPLNYFRLKFAQKARLPR
jgi:hypothetical protein